MARKWEYLVLTRPTGALDGRDLTTYGHQRWELVSVREVGSLVELVFKREVR